MHSFLDRWSCHFWCSQIPEWQTSQHCQEPIHKYRMIMNVVVVSSQETSRKEWGNQEIIIYCCLLEKTKAWHLMTCVHPLNDPIDPGCWVPKSGISFGGERPKAMALPPNWTKWPMWKVRKRRNVRKKTCTSSYLVPLMVFLRNLRCFDVLKPGEGLLSICWWFCPIRKQV